MNLIKKQLYIPTTKKKRTLRILLPDDYAKSDVNYPVLYMHDGQNLFEDQTAFNQTSWKIYDTLSLLKKEKKIKQDLIIVGIDNSDIRFFEYSPWVGKGIIKDILKVQVGGLGDVYADFIVKKVKPYIDKNFRTKPSYEHTSIAGSSMGAYISTYIASKYPNIFKQVGIFSLASWFNEQDFLTYVKYAELKREMRFLSLLAQMNHQINQIQNLARFIFKTVEI